MNQDKPPPEPAECADAADRNAGGAAAAPAFDGESVGQAEMPHDIGELRARLAAAEARERVLRHELQHRVQNMLALIRSIYRRTRESGSDQEEFADHFQGRLDAVARYHARVDLSSFGIELEDMIRDELLEAGCSDGPDCTIAGPPVRLGEKVAELIGLAIHELTTNSIKFGAFGRKGKLAVEWSVAEGRDGQMLDFRWTETDVAAVSSAPRPYGFGQQLIEEALPYQLGATTTFTLSPGRFECTIQVALPAALPSTISTDQYSA